MKSLALLLCMPALTASARNSLEQYRKTAVGAQAPAFRIATLNEPGTIYTLEGFKGNYVLLDFWATWCV